MSLVELLVALSVFAVVVAIGIQSFPTVLRQTRLQSQIAGRQMDNVIGLDLLRTDIEQAGFGLPWSFQGSINYSEAASDPNGFNDAPSNVPRAIVGSNDTELNGSDRITIKSSVIGGSSTAQRWIYIESGVTPSDWNGLVSTDRIIVIRPERRNVGQSKELVMNGSAFFVELQNLSNILPQGPQRYIVYGIDPDTSLRMPFNRADYYVASPSAMPSSCAPGTGVLYKANINQSNGGFLAMPILDCIADMQIQYLVDTSTPTDGVPDSSVDAIPTGWTAEDIRNRLREVRFAILTHEGGRDTSYRHPQSAIAVGPKTVNVASIAGTDKWQYYRWKVIELAVKPKGLSW